MKKKVLSLSVIGILLVSLLGGCTSMQTAKVPVTPQYPDRPITMIVPFSAGSGLDVLARTFICANSTF